MAKILIVALLLIASAVPASAALLPAVTHPIQHPKRDAKVAIKIGDSTWRAVGHTAKKTLKGVGKEYL